MAEAQWIGMRELKRAIARNPQKVKNEAKNFLVRGLAAYKRGLIRNPWRIGATGGGVPVATGNLRDSHVTKVGQFKASIGPAPHVDYARYVFFGTRYMQPRPWLDHIKRTKEPEVQRLYRDMLRNITKDLAR